MTEIYPTEQLFAEILRACTANGMTAGNLSYYVGKKGCAESLFMDDRNPLFTTTITPGTTDNPQAMIEVVKKNIPRRTFEKIFEDLEAALEDRVIVLTFPEESIMDAITDACVENHIPHNTLLWCFDGPNQPEYLLYGGAGVLLKTEITPGTREKPKGTLKIIREQLAQETFIKIIETLEAEFKDRVSIII